MHPHRTTLAVIASGLVLGVTLGGCGDDEPLAATTTSAVSSTTETAPPVTPAPACSSDPAVPTGTWADGPVDADLDGDGAPDEVSMYVVDDRTVELVVAFASGAGVLTTYDDAAIGTESGVRVDRVADVDGDGADDLWLVVGAGAAAEVVTLVRGLGCRPTRPEVLGIPNQYAVGASVGALNGIECVDTDDDLLFDGFWEHAAESTGESSYRGTSTFWSVSESGGELVRGEQETFTIDLATGDHNRYARLSCE